MLDIPELTPSPYLHDRWEDQVALEQEMLSSGRQRMQDKINKARKKKDMTRLRPYRSLIKEFVHPVSEELTKWIESASSRRGARPVALKCLKQIDPGTAALVALKTVFRMLGIEKRLILGMAVEIGTWIEHEVRSVAWLDADPESWNSLARYYARHGSNSAHQKRARVAIFNKHIKDQIGFNEWSDKDRQRVGLQMIDCVVKGTRRFRVVADKSSMKKDQRRGIKLSWPMILEADEGLTNWLAAAMDDEMVYWPVYMPTLIPPKPWVGPSDGGYWTPFVKSPFLIRFKASHQDQKQRAIDEYMALDMPTVYEALNFVQDTPWRINERVLDVASEIWDKDLALGGFPRQEEEAVPERPAEAVDNIDIRREWSKDAGAIRRRNATRLSHFIRYRRALLTAERLRSEPRFYFPHMLDFRGRMYPIPSDLSPQGEDLHRGLLTFDGGKPLGEHGSQWLAVHIANQFGMDKVGFDERLQWADERADWWKSISEDPMADRRWLEAKSPWQALAAAFEYGEYLKHGEEYVCSLPIRVDGTCNGIQHLSAMVRDHVGGASVNLTPGDEPADIYQDVADELAIMLDDRRGDTNADLWLDVFDGTVPREVTKRPVMILPYGGTRHAYFEYTMDWLMEADPNGTLINDERRWEAVGYLVKLLWHAVSEKVVKGREVMEWLKNCSKIASATGRPIHWRTPSGFIVRHFYGERERVQIDTMIDGQRLQLVNWEVTPVLDPRSQAKGIAPNFVHSMDASSLMTCASFCRQSGLEHLSTIHDSYGTLPADMWTLFKCIREAFVATYDEPVLEQFLTACKDVGGYDKAWPKLPEFGELDVSQVRESDYFFA